MTALLCVGFAAGPGVAHAADWSGLDARHYDGPVHGAGALIESVPLDPALSVTGAGAAYRILYATVDQHDRPAVSTGVVFTPRTPSPPGGWPVVAWAHGTVGLGDDCTPSARPRSERDDEYLTHWLDQGYAVVASDYAGLGTPGLMSYLNSVTTARGVVDSVIAAHRMGLALSPKWAVVGQSQGGAAAVATARWATDFSAGAGLDFRGVVATGTPAHVENIVKQAGPDMVVPAALADMTVPGFFTAPLTSVPGATEAVDAYMGIPADGYDRPVFLGVGLRDRDVPPELTLRFSEQLSANGEDVTLKVYPEQDHSGTVLASLPDSTPFLARQFS
ncbi:lipase [Mycolicibacterium flavescens]|uniref:Lipase n=2 Tax=Mycolicibacterium flavescens TaxID=1776 RepID=A0A1E3RBX5_MYCFV|nr:lipase family protein [Mycolicibacterium flavescens]ODQ87319.1 lipase [Mycolicibacterium flavescens]